MIRLLHCFFALALLSICTSAATASPRIERISFAERSDGKGFVVRIHASERIPESQLEISQPERDWIDVLIRNASLSRSVRRDAEKGPIRSYTVAQRSGTVVIRLKLREELPLAVVAYPDRDTNDYLVALNYSSLDPPSSVPTRFIGETIESSRERFKLDCVVIDAGHGGKDPGAVSNGVREKDVNLGVALKVGQYVREGLGLRVVYTRDRDRFVDLAKRGQIANERCGKLFVSIHVNSARNRSASGTETYFLGLHKTEAARKVMERENSVIRFEENPEQYSHFGEDALIMQTMAQSAYLRESEQLAGLIESQFRLRADRKSRGVKQAGLVVLWQASMPAVLVETGFLTNRSEARFLKSSRGQDLIASAIFRAIREYRDHYERGLGVEVAE
jgi:N-acetylmuramoyl-L-alanine amidase